MSKYATILGITFGARYKHVLWDGFTLTGFDAGRLTVEFDHENRMLAIRWNILGPSVTIGKVDPDWTGGKVIGPFYFTKGL